MLTDLQKTAAKLQGTEMLGPEAVALRLGVPAIDVEAWEKLPEYDAARAEGLFDSVFATADHLFGIEQGEK